MSSSGFFVALARNCLVFTLDYIVMQIRKTNRERYYCMSCLSWPGISQHVSKGHLEEEFFKHE